MLPEDVQLDNSVSKDKRLKITEIFYSLQGESNTVGIPTIFIRLTGCPLRCQYCDTEYAFHGGEWQSFDSILNQIKKYPTRYITVTGGEPLAQKKCVNFLKQLCDANYQVSLETSGAIDISNVDTRVVKVLDTKTPGSGECEKNLYSNYSRLNSNDQIKFVICNRVDYDWAKKLILDYKLTEQCEILFSVSHHELAAKQLADWILEDGLVVRFQVQLHKILWGDEHGR
ncbi:7-carboxy-7-deazaguanine synthase [hydrothermal vent metagenome]|uniref:7-carboxy-7-deazaguanine synthase n=1 Tax=hydrothermal vent metagenome TaxID=652676 RepID=A0A3B1AGL7_9ZZZZ